MSTSNLPVTSKAIKRLQCMVCGRSTEHTPAELLEFTKQGWPLCCNEVMMLVAVTEVMPALPTPGDSLPPST